MGFSYICSPVDKSLTDEAQKRVARSLCNNANPFASLCTLVCNVSPTCLFTAAYTVSTTDAAECNADGNGEFLDFLTRQVGGLSFQADGPAEREGGELIGTRLFRGPFTCGPTPNTLSVSVE